VIPIPWPIANGKNADGDPDVFSGEELAQLRAPASRARQTDRVFTLAAADEVFVPKSGER
jgi:hypothetical protein